MLKTTSFLHFVGFSLLRILSAGDHAGSPLPYSLFIKQKTINGSPASIDGFSLYFTYSPISFIRRRRRSLISAMNSELVGLPFMLLTV